MLWLQKPAGQGTLEAGNQEAGMNDFYERMQRILTEDSLKTEEPMRNHTTFRIGGPARYFAAPKTEAQFIEAVRLCRTEKVPFYVIGNGSNLLVNDKG